MTRKKQLEKIAYITIEIIDSFMGLLFPSDKRLQEFNNIMNGYDHERKKKHSKHTMQKQEVYLEFIDPQQIL